MPGCARICAVATSRAVSSFPWITRKRRLDVPYRTMRNRAPASNTCFGRRVLLQRTRAGWDAGPRAIARPNGRSRQLLVGRLLVLRLLARRLRLNRLRRRDSPDPLPRDRLYFLGDVKRPLLLGQASSAAPPRASPP